MNNSPSQRLDLWLYRARFFKTRALAARNIKTGKIRLVRNHGIQKVFKPHFGVQIGDQISFIRAQSLQYIEVRALPDRRGPATEAQQHYISINPDDVTNCA